LKHSKFGPFFVCEDKEKCKFKASVDDYGKPAEKKVKDIVYSKHKCPKCKKLLVERTSKKGKTFLGCQDFSKGCKGIYDLEGNEIKFKKFKKWKNK